MAERTLYELLIELQGSADPSLAAAFSKAQAQLRALDAAAKGVNTALKGMASQSGASSRTMISHANQIVSAWKKAGASIKNAIPGMGLMRGLAHYSGIGAVVGGIGGSIELSNLIKESSKIAAERETLTTQVHTLLANQGKGGQTKDFLMSMRRYADKESVFQYMPVANTAASMLAFGYQMKDILPEMRKIGELAKDDKTLELVGNIAGQAHSRGYITKQDLNRITQDAQVAIYPALLKAMGETDTLQNRVALFKRLRTPSKDPVSNEYLEKAFAILGGPGGSMFGHQIAQLLTFQGQFNSLLDRGKDAMEGIGTTANKFFYPLMRMMNQMDPGTILGFFDKLEPKAAKLGHDIAQSLTDLSRTGQFQRMGNTLQEIFTKAGKAFAEMFGIKGGNTIDTITAAFGKMNEALDFLNKNFDALVIHGKAFFDVWVVAKVLGVALGVANAINIMRDAFIGLRLAQAGASVTGAADGATGVGLGGAAALAGLPLAGAVTAKVLADKYGLGKYYGGGSDTPQEPIAPRATALAALAWGDLWQKSHTSAVVIKKETDLIDEGWKSIFGHVSDVLNAFQSWDPWAPHLGGNAGLHGGLPDPGQTQQGWSTYEQYGTEDHSSNYGPAGNKLTQDDVHVGLGPNVMMQYGLHQGDRVHIPGMGWRQINESSARKNGIEFFKDKPGSGPKTPDKLKIDQIQRGSGPVINVSYAPTIHGVDAAGLAGTLKSHSEDLSRLLHRAIAEDSRLSYA